MSEQRDPAIKLFGKTIQLLPGEGLPSKAVVFTNTSSNDEQHHPSTLEDKKKPSQEEYPDVKGEDLSIDTCAEDSIDPSTSSAINDDPKTRNTDKETSSTNTTKTEDPSETSNSDEKTPKKPDKILPCPRCNSKDTKFCYYNNYNVNQPRHFCKNCQRYWTAGGTMRNVPVGSGRRKNKSSSASHHRQIIVSEALQAARAEATSGIHLPSVLTFGSDAPLCESMASALNLADKSLNDGRNEHHQQEQKNGDDHSTVSSSAASKLTDKGEAGTLKNFQGYPLQVPCFPPPPWPYPWNSAQFGSPMVPPAPTTFGPSGFPVSFYPTPQYWSCTVPGPWSMPWLTPQNSSPDQYALSSAPSSPLGKHSRDGSMLTSSNSGKEEVSEEKDSERGVLIPKTLRINDPNEAAKSSIWSTLGIKNDNSNSITGGNLFKAFERKGDQKNDFDEKSTVLHANPAALSRSLNFRESS